MLNRRHFLQQAAALSAVGFSGFSASANAIAGGEKTLHLYNIHTGETVHSTFWAEGSYIDSEIEMLDLLLRDFRANDVIAMERQLYHHLYRLQTMFSAKQPMNIISGYRSPVTNARLSSNSSGVAKRSLHMEGRAIDLRIPGVSTRDLQKAASDMRFGGVGYYPGDGFVHIDTGRVRRWEG